MEIIKILSPGGKFHWLKNRYQRWKYGAGCCDVYSLYDYLAPIILKGLIQFRKKSASHPMGLTADQWEKKIDLMIYAFESIEKDNNCEDIDHKKAQRGFKAFGEWYRNLWY